jgi:hypothetical protein
MITANNARNHLTRLSRMLMLFSAQRHSPRTASIDSGGAGGAGLFEVTDLPSIRRECKALLEGMSN